jgi:hypothetical protein
MKTVFVAERQMEEEVFDGGNALLGEGLCDLRTDAFDELDRGVECRHFKMLAGEGEPGIGQLWCGQLAPGQG